MSEELRQFNPDDALQAIIRNKDSFVGLSHQQIAVKLITEYKYGGMVAQHLDKFQNIDLPTITDLLIKNRAGIEVAMFIDKFRGIDHWELATKLIDTQQGSAVAKYVINFDVNHLETARYLVSKAQARDLAYELPNFHSLDTGVAQALINQGLFDKLAASLESFQDLDVSIAEQLIRLNCAESVAQHLQRFKPEVKSIAKSLSDEHLLMVVKNIRYLNLSQSEIAELIPQSGLTYEQIKILIDQLFFSELVAVVSVNEATAQTVGAVIKDSWTDYQKEVTKMFKLLTGCPLQAAAFSRLLELLQTNFDTTRTSLIQEPAPERPQLQQRSEYQRMNLVREIYLIYLDQLLYRELVIIQHQLHQGRITENQQIQDMTQPLEPSRFSDVINIIGKIKSIEERMKRVVHFSQEYLTIAVNSELNNQRSGDAYLEHHADIFQNGSTEDIILFFRRAQHRFIYNSQIEGEHIPWGKTGEDRFGGEFWAKIAETGAEMWALPPVDMTTAGVWFDHFVDLQHHQGFIFDKDPKRIAFGIEEKGIMRDLLDLKRDSSSIEELLDFGVECDLIDAQERAEYLKSYQMIIDIDLQKIPTRPANYD